jgi:hypothetical protein
MPGTWPSSPATSGSVARATRAALVTRDLDFADVRQYPPEHYEGIVVLRLSDDAVASEIAAAVRRFVSADDFLRELRGRLAIVEHDRVRFRPPLPDR